MSGVATATAYVPREVLTPGHSQSTSPAVPYTHGGSCETSSATAHVLLLGANMNSGSLIRQLSQRSLASTPSESIGGTPVGTPRSVIAVTTPGRPGAVSASRSASSRPVLRVAAPQTRRLGPSSSVQQLSRASGSSSLRSTPAGTPRESYSQLPRRSAIPSPSPRVVASTQVAASPARPAGTPWIGLGEAKGSPAIARLAAASLQRPRGLSCASSLCSSTSSRASSLDRGVGYTGLGIPGRFSTPRTAPPQEERLAADCSRARSSSTRLVRPARLPEQRSDSKGAGSGVPATQRFSGIPLSMLQTQPHTHRTPSRSRSVTLTPRLARVGGPAEQRPKVSLGAHVAANESILAASLQAAATRQAAGNVAPSGSGLSGQQGTTLRQRLNQAGLQQDIESLKAGLQSERLEKRSLTERVEALTRARTSAGTSGRPCPSIAAALEPKLSKKVAFSVESAGISPDEGGEDLGSQASASSRGTARTTEDGYKTMRSDVNGGYANGRLESSSSSVQTMESDQDVQRTMRSDMSERNPAAAAADNANQRASSSPSTSRSKDASRRKLGTKRRDFTMKEVIEELAHDLGIPTVASWAKREDESSQPLAQASQHAADELAQRSLAARAEAMARARAAAAAASGDFRDDGEKRHPPTSPVPVGGALYTAADNPEEYGVRLESLPNRSSMGESSKWPGSSAGKEMSTSQDVARAFHDGNSSLTSVQTLSEDGAVSTRPLSAASPKLPPPSTPPIFMSEVLDDLGRDLGLSNENVTFAAEQFAVARPPGEHEQRSLAARVEALARARAAAGEGSDSSYPDAAAFGPVLPEHRAKKVVFAAREVEVCSIDPPVLESCSASWTSTTAPDDDASRMAEIYLGVAAPQSGSVLLSEEIVRGLQD